MGEKGADLDYRVYLRKGQKLVGPTTLEEKAKSTLDQAPRIRAKVPRKLNEKIVDQPVVTQTGFDENLKEIREMQTMSTSGRKRTLKPITPIEQEEINQSLLGINDREVAKKARAQRAAIRSHPKKP